ncbi:TRP containing protein [Legionella geestiana]|uniref:TRP containing protein n=1 Tax=Legionella geestiana TaxID=45065 RepID=A0A0W0U4B2_9GAMM|nr:tetratricopeptide repeat protein [Legionella geestiana]KTD02883.1 TRP containing protein [Legionella geestiana]QBS11680.1 tetratricopeptide repeat protein [Legionella geestiana]STX53633.1 TRP containing protein [Legionella geestiana]
MSKRILVFVTTCMFACATWAESAPALPPDTLSSSPLQALPASDPDAVFADVKALRNAGKLTEARAMAAEYLTSHPDDVDVRLLLGLINLQLQEYDLAANNLSRVLNSTPRYTDARAGLILTRLAQKRMDEARTLLLAGLQLSPDDTVLLGLAKRFPELESPPPAEVKRISVLPVLNFPENATAKPVPDYQKETLEKLQALRHEGRLKEAKTLATTYLKAHPKDPDITLILGLLYLQTGEPVKARMCFETVLSEVPDYVDARAGLAKSLMAQKQYKAATETIDEGLHKSPGDMKLLDIKKQLYAIMHAPRQRMPNPVVLSPKAQKLANAAALLKSGNITTAEQMLKPMLAASPDDAEVRVALANCYLERHQDLKASLLIRAGLRRTPESILLRMKAGDIFFIMRQYALAAKAFLAVLAKEPSNKEARAKLDEVNSISPRYAYGINEVGISSDNAYVSDLRTNWDYSSAFIRRDTVLGPATLRVNYASRLQTKAPQYEIDFSPRYNRNIYVDLIGAWSDQPVLFPNWLGGAEGYANIPGFLEVSAGGRYAKIAETWLSTWTGSLNSYPGSYWLSFRPYYFLPKNNQEDSVLYTATARRYFTTDDHYIGINAGTGRSPDLADLLTVNFIVIKNNFVNLQYTFPIARHHILVDLRAGYQNWVYPSGLNRNLYDGNAGFRYRFENA